MEFTKVLIGIHSLLIMYSFLKILIRFMNLLDNGYMRLEIMVKYTILIMTICKKNTIF